jgi:tetratricopeptide (TPR) repeat protein
MLSWHTQPIFISSTFLDMQIERDFLRDIVFPELEEILLQKKIHIEPVDLRWGIDSTSEISQREKELQILKVCLDEIDRCRPFMIIILGNRYGSILPEAYLQIAAEEKGIVLSNPEKSVTALEIEYGIFHKPDVPVNCFFYFREIPDLNSLPAMEQVFFDDRLNEDAHIRTRFLHLEAIKDRIRKEYPDRCRTYSLCLSDKNKQMLDLQALQQMIIADLKGDLVKIGEQIEISPELNWQINAKKAFEFFVQHKTRDFTGRSDLLFQLKNAALSKSTSAARFLCLTGESGTGKSSIMAMLSQHLAEADCLLLPYAAGMTSGNDLDAIIRFWSRLLASSLNPESPDPLEGLQTLSEKLEIWTSLLFEVAKTRRVVLILDAINELERSAINRKVSWLPQNWPDNVVFITSAIPGEESEALRLRAQSLIIPIPPLAASDADNILSVICRRHHKSLFDGVRKSILRKETKDGKPGYHNPLWLTIVMEQLLLLDADDFEEAGKLAGFGANRVLSLMLQRIEAYDAAVPVLLEQVFANADSDFKSRYGINWIYPMLEYLSATRSGLRESDLQHLLQVADPVEFTRQFSLVRRFLRAHLQQSGAYGQWYFTHQQPLQMLRNMLRENNSYTDRHHEISVYLNKLPPSDELQKSELLFHLFQSKQTEGTIHYLASEIQNAAGIGSITADFFMENTDKKINTELDWFSKTLLVKGVKLSIAQCAQVATRVSEEICYALLQRQAYHLVLDMLGRTKYFIDTLPASYLDNSAITIAQVKLGRKYASILLIMGKSKEAVQHLRLTAMILLKRYQNNTISHLEIFHIYDILADLGDLAVKRGDVQEAKKDYSDAQRILQELLTIYPDNNLVKSKYAQILERLANLSLDIGDFSESIRIYQQAVDLNQEVFSLYPEDPETKTNKAILYYKLARAYSIQDSFSEKILPLYKVSYNILQEQYRDNPENKYIFETFTSLLLLIGDHYRNTEDWAACTAYYEEVFLLLQINYRRSPHDLFNSNNLVNTHLRLGQIKLSKNENSDAFRHFIQAEELAQELLRKAPDRSLILESHAQALLAIGAYSMSQNFNREAVSYYLSALESIEKLHLLMPEDWRINLHMSTAFYSLGHIYKVMSDIDNSISYYTKSQDILQKLLLNAPENNTLLWFYVATLQGMGEVMLHQEEIEPAMANFKQSIAILEALRARSVNKHIEEDVLAGLYLSLGKAYEKSGQNQLANDFFRKSLILLEKSFQAGTLNSRFIENRQWLKNKLNKLDVAAGLEIFHKYTRKHYPTNGLTTLLRAVNYEELVIKVLAHALNGAERKLTLIELTQLFENRRLENTEVQNKIDSNHTGDERSIFVDVIQIFALTRWTSREIHVWRQLVVLPRKAYAVSVLADLINIDLAELSIFVNELYCRGWIQQENDKYILHFQIWKPLQYHLRPSGFELTGLLDSLTQKIKADSYKNPLIENYQWFSEAVTVSEYIQDQQHGTGIVLQCHLAFLYFALGAYNHAQKWFTTAIETQENNENVTLSLPFMGLGSVYRIYGKKDDALTQHKRAVTIAEMYLPENHSDLALTYQLLGQTYVDFREWNQAHACLTKAVSIREKIFPADHPDLAKSYHALASFYYHKGNSKQFEQLIFKSLAIQEASLPAFHPDLARSYNDIGNYYLQVGIYDQAQKYVQLAITIREKFPWPQHLELARSYYNISRVYHAVRQFDQAEIFHLKAIKIREYVLPKDHIDLSYSYNALAATYQEMKNYDAAQNFYNKALEIQLTIEGFKEQDLTAIYLHLGWIHYQKKAFPEAVDSFRKTVEIFNKSASTTDAQLAEAFFYLAWAQYACKQFEEAVGNYQETIRIQESIYTLHDPLIIRSYEEIALAHYALKQYELSLTFNKKVMEIRERFFQQDKQLSIIYHRMGLNNKMMGQDDNALLYFYKSLELRISLLSPQHPEIAQYYHDLGMFYSDVKDYEQALIFYFDALNLRKTILGTQHLDVAHTYNNIGYVLSLIEEYKCALEYLQNAITIREPVLKPPHAELVRSYTNMSNIYRILGDEDKMNQYLIKMDWAKKQD